MDPLTYLVHISVITRVVFHDVIIFLTSTNFTWQHEILHTQCAILRVQCVIVHVQDVILYLLCAILHAQCIMLHVNMQF